MAEAEPTRPTVLRFGDFEVDLEGALLRKRGVRVGLRDQSFQVLASLLEHPGRVVTRGELQERLWPGEVFLDFDNNLNAAVGRLRQALGDSAERPRFIETLPKHGYRFMGALLSDELPPPRAPGARVRRRWRPAIDAEVPATAWVLEEKLGAGGFGEVWLARHTRLKELRVFKFCLREDRVRALKREMTLFRVWRSRVGDHPHLVQLLDVSLDRPPFYLEEEYVPGRDLRRWCAAQGGIARVPVELRLELVAQAAEGLAAAHDAGIIHRDIKPGNILIAGSISGSEGATARDCSQPTVKLTDFGVGRLLSTEALAGISATGLTSARDTKTSTQGTHAYLAPEVLMGRPATVQSDLYSMGVVLYQLLVEDFAQPVTTDWAREIEDPVVREDLRRCFAGRPEERFGSARELADRLRSASSRREALAVAARAAFDKSETKIASVAVLPFANLSADPDNEYLGDGIAEDLLSALSQVPGLRVPGRTSCFAFKGRTDDLRRIGRELGVESVLEGSVRRAGSRLRVVVQLINVADGFYLWSERYEREMSDVFVLQDEITRSIVTALTPRLSSARRALVKPYTHSVDAYELCLQARYQHQRRTPAGLRMALGLFEQAALRDPECAPAHAGIAHVCLLLSYFGGMPTREGMPRMMAASLQALALDDTLAITHVRMGDALCFHDWDWVGAEGEFLRALELEPESAEALCRYGLFLWARLRDEEALARLRKAIELDPFSLDANWFLGWAYLSLGRLEEAEGVARKMLAMEGNAWTGHELLAWIESVRGRWPEATRAYEAAWAIEGGAATGSVLCWCHTQAGRLAEARQVLERLEQLTTTRILPSTFMAIAYDAMGDQAQARACMERAFEERHMLLVHLRAFITTIGWLSHYRSMLDEYGL